MTSAVQYLSAGVGLLLWKCRLGAPSFRDFMVSTCVPGLRVLDRAVEEILSRNQSSSAAAAAATFPPPSQGRKRPGKNEGFLTGGDPGSFRSLKSQHFSTNHSDQNEKEKWKEPLPFHEEFSKACDDIWVHGKAIRQPDEALMQGIKEAVSLANQIKIESLSDLKVDSCCLLLQSLGKLVTHESLASHVTNQCGGLILALVEKITSQDDGPLTSMCLSDTLYRLGYLGHTVRRLKPDIDNELQAMLEMGGMLLKEMTPLDVGKVMHALTLLKFRNVEFLRRVDAHVVDNFEDYAIRDLSRVLWAHGKLSFDESRVFRKVVEYFRDVDVVTERREEFYPQYIAHLCWAAGRLGSQKNEVALFDKLIKVSTETLDRFQPQELTQLLKGCLDWSYHPGVDFLRVFCRIFSQDINKYGVRAVSTCVVSLAHFAYRDLRVLEVTRQYILNKSHQPEQRHIFDFTWALSILNGLTKETIQWTLKNTSRVVDQLTGKEKRQFYQFLLSVHVLNPRLTRHLLFPEDFETECYMAWKKTAMNSHKTSKQVLAVFGAIRKLGFICVRNEALVGRRFSVNTIRHKSLNQVFALEFSNGFRNAPHLVKGPGVWRRRVLQALGFTVLSLDDEWGKLSSPAKQMEYIKGRIRKLVVLESRNTGGRGG